MKKLLKIYLLINGKKVATCNYCELNPFSTYTAREFTFHKLRLKENVDLKFIGKINIRILCKTAYSNAFYPINDFNIIVLDYQYEPTNKKDWCVYGIFDHGNFKEPYSQGVIDIFNIWQNGKKIDWFGLPIESHLKNDYIFACLDYTSIRTDTVDKEIFEIDMSQVKVYRDILYLLSVAFFGEKGYMGHSFHTFADCLLILYNNKGYSDNKKVLFKNCKDLVVIDDVKFFDDLVKELSRYKFTVIVE